VNEEPQQTEQAESIAADAAPDVLGRRGILEALLFVVEEPIPLAKLQEILGDAAPEETAASLQELALALESQGFGLMVQEVAGGFRLTTRPEALAWIQRLQQVKPTRLSRAALETLAIIAYRQPITKAEVEQIRGVAIDGVLRTLLERELVRIMGRKAEAGRPILYGTSQQFLEHFGFRALSDLPSLREIDELVGPQPAEAFAPLRTTADLPGQTRGLFDAGEPDESRSGTAAPGDNDAEDSETPPTSAA
jgi:segregation and condensation protein B